MTRMTIQKNLMRAACAALVIAAVTVAPAQAGMILEDDFDGASGSTVNAAKWVATNGPPAVQLDGNSNVALTSNNAIIAAGGPGGSYGFAPTVSEYGQLSITGYTRPGSTNDSRIGLTTIDDANTEIMLRTATVNGVYYLRVADGAGNNTTYNTFIGKADAGPNDWRIDWYTDRVEVYYNGVLRIDTSAPTVGQVLSTGGSGAVTVATNLIPASRISGGTGNLTDAIVWQSIPEPASLALLGLGSLLIVRRRHEA